MLIYLYFDNIGTMQETHYYDNKLDSIKSDLEKDLSRARSVPEDQKRTEFSKLRALLLPKISRVGLLYFDSIANNPPVYDPINLLWSKDILYLCCELSKKEKVDMSDFLENLSIQFEDMATGFCPQGQTIRLLQIVKSFAP